MTGRVGMEAHLDQIEASLRDMTDTQIVAFIDRMLKGVAASGEVLRAREEVELIARGQVLCMTTAVSGMALMVLAIRNGVDEFAVSDESAVDRVVNQVWQAMA